MIKRSRVSKYTTLELNQMKVIDDLQEDIKTLKLEITELNKDINAYRMVISIRDNTIERLKKMLKESYKSR